MLVPLGGSIKGYKTCFLRPSASIKLYYISTSKIGSAGDRISFKSYFNTQMSFEFNFIWSICLNSSIDVSYIDFNELNATKSMKYENRKNLMHSFLNLLLIS